MTAWPMADQWLGRAFEATAGTDTPMHPMCARVYHGDPDSGDALILPIVDGLRIGTELVAINYAPSASWAIKQPDGTTIATIAAGEAAELFLYAINEPGEGSTVRLGSWTVTAHTVGVPS